MKKSKKLLSIFVALCILATFTCIPVAHAENSEEPDPIIELGYVENELLIRINDEDYATSTLASSDICSVVESNLASSLNATVSADYTCPVNDSTSVYVVSIEDIGSANLSIPDLCADINADNVGMYAEPNYLCELTETSLDTGVDLQEFEPLFSLGGVYNDWHLRETFATEALSFCEKKGDNVVVAVLDTGCNFEHEHLKNSMITFELWPYTYHGFNVVDDDYLNDITDNHGHGTAVASVISGSNTTNRVNGISCNSKILPIKITEDGTFPIIKIIEAVEMIKEYNHETVPNSAGALQPVSVINMSFRYLRNITYTSYSTSVRLSLESIADECVLVAGAGNDELNTNKQAAYPAGFQNVIGVMAYDSTRTMADYSNYDKMGYHYNIAAPGSSITVASHSTNNGYNLASGTSFASPIVAGAVALYMSNCPNATIGQIKEHLLESATDRVKPYHQADNIEGHLKLNIVNYLNKGLLNNNSVFSGTCGYDATWTYTHSDRSLVISGTEMINDYTRGDAPWYRFRNLITTCEISDDITYIGNYSFIDLSALNSLDMGSGIEYIGDLSFAYCKKLPTLNMPNNEIEIALGSFLGCSLLTNITLPPSLYSPSNCSYLFQNCTSLSSVTIPTGWTILPDGMFFGCTSLSSVTLPNSIQRIDAVAFKNCCNLANLNLPQNLIEIRPRAFENCTGFTSIELPRSLTKIKSRAFSGCTNLRNITFYDNLTMMQSNIFENCPNLTVSVYYNSMALDYAQNKNINCLIRYRLNPAENSGITFDRTNNSISNLPTGISTDIFSEQYVDLDDGFTLEYETPTTGVISTGTVINVLNEDIILETYTVV